MSDWEAYEEDPDETVYAQGRLSGRTYASVTFPLKRTGSLDDGQPARFIRKVFDPDSETVLEREGEAWLVRESPKGRYQIQLLVARESGNVKELWIHRVPAASDSTGAVKTLLNLQQPEAGRLVELLQMLPSIPVEGATTVRVDDALLHDIFASPESLQAVYQRDPERFRQLISDDAASRDVVAVAARRRQVAEFRRLLEDPAYFDAAVLRTPRQRPEDVWQAFFEANPWIFGVSLAGQLLTAWDASRLEQNVTGRSLAGVGKRADALLRTAGQIRSFVFAEIKTHRTPLLVDEYRAGCWRPSKDLAGGVAQVQGMVHLAVRDFGERLAERDADGADIPGEFTYLLRPRSFLVIGQLAQMTGASGGHNQDQFRSFELYRRALSEPEVITFDELLARAEWVVETADGHVD